MGKPTRLTPDLIGWEGLSQGPTGRARRVPPTTRLKRTGLPIGQPDSLYPRDSPWNSSYHIQNSFQLHIIAVFFDNFITRVYLLHNPEGLGYELTI